MTAGGRRLPRPATPERLEKAAYAYLERFATSEENLRRVLMRRVERSVRLHGTDREEGAHAVDAIVARFRATGLVDDRVYAEGRAISLARRGDSPRLMRRKLAQKGVEATLIDDTLAGLDEELGDLALSSAIRLARRRRLGPFRQGDREDRREKDMAALARAGFAYDIARQVIEAEDEAELDALLAAAGG
ncbi:MAG: RecX family transcriptional regulator [Azospirillaceae bacterium]